MSVFFLKLFFFLLPWQTRWIYASGTRDGLPWEWWTVAVTAAEVLLWAAALSSLREVKRSLDSVWDKLRNLTRTVIPAVRAGIQRLLRRPAFVVLLAISVVIIPLVAWHTRPIALFHLFDGLLLFMLLRTHPNPRRFVPWFLAGMIPAALLGFWQFAMQSAQSSTLLGLAAHDAWQAGASVVETISGRWLRAYGPFPHPNIFGGYLAVATVLALSSRARWTQFLAPFFAVVLVLTFSRSAWLAMAIGIIFVIARSAATKQSSSHVISAVRAGIQWSFAMTALAVVVTTTIVLPLITTRVASVGRLETKSHIERSAAWQRAVADFKAHPFIGVGLGRGADRGEPVHDVLALVAAETGLSGAATLAAFLGFMVVTAWRRRVLAVPLLATLAILTLLDHYLWSLLPGLWLGAVALGLSSEK